MSDAGDAVVKLLKELRCDIERATRLKAPWRVYAFGFIAAAVALMLSGAARNRSFAVETMVSGALAIVVLAGFARVVWLLGVLSVDAGVNRKTPDGLDKGLAEQVNRALEKAAKRVKDQKSRASWECAAFVIEAATVAAAGFGVATLGYGLGLPAGPQGATWPVLALAGGGLVAAALAVFLAARGKAAAQIVDSCDAVLEKIYKSVETAEILEYARSGQRPQSQLSPEARAMLAGIDARMFSLRGPARRRPAA
ncbi:MAG: hypothetical protein HXY23_08395 [Parvularculaceae bacterium]|nr:hypothetical protein [Parvularculaceae bacterium]